MKKKKLWMLTAALACGLPAADAVAGTVDGTVLGPAFGTGSDVLTSGSVSYDSVVSNAPIDVTLNFASPISGSSLFGYVFLDTDDSVLTGSTLAQLDSNTGPNLPLGLGLSQIPTSQIPTGLGVDLVISLDSLGGSTPGELDVFDTRDPTNVTPLSSLVISPYSGTTLSFSIPTSILTGFTLAPNIYFGAIVGDGFGPTDTMEGLSPAPTAVPEPSSVAMAVTSLIVAAGVIRLRRV
jgi:hypothetical protein